MSNGENCKKRYIQPELKQGTSTQTHKAMAALRQIWGIDPIEERI